MRLFDRLHLAPAPDPALAIERYRKNAPGYDASAERTMGLRRRAIGLLGLASGQTVLDVACGTGLSFGLFQEGVGPEGRIIGLELSADMLALIKARPYMTTFEGLDRPWSRLGTYLERFEWEPVMAGIGYIGHGMIRPTDAMRR